MMETANVQLENILLTMAGEWFGKRKAASIVGGEKRLLNLIAKGEITAEKRSNAQNGKWMCNAADVLRHCRNKRVK